MTVKNRSDIVKLHIWEYSEPFGYQSPYEKKIWWEVAERKRGYAYKVFLPTDEERRAVYAKKNVGGIEFTG